MQSLFGSPKPDQIEKIIVVQAQPKLTCGSKNLITNICIDKACDAPSLHCQNKGCTFCQPHIQNSCTSLQLRSFINLIKKKTQKINSLVQDLVIVETKMLKSVEVMRNELIKKLKCNSMTEHEHFMLENLLIEEGKSSKFKGREVALLVDKLKKNDIVDKDAQLKKIEDELSKISQQIFQTEKVILKSVGFPDMNQYALDSKIMQNNYEGIKFIFQQLNCNKLKLLYRASEHDFSAEKFHAKCDEVSNTLVILKTEYNKILAGYTPPSFGLSLYNHNSSNYIFKLGFILSINEKQR